MRKTHFLNKPENASFTLTGPLFLWKMRFMHDGQNTADETGLAARIHDLRRGLGLSQARFGVLIGVDQSNVSRWENGATPEDVHIVKMAELAGRHPAVFRYGPPAGELGPAAPGLDAPGPAARDAGATVSVVGYVGAGEEMFPFDDHALGAGLETVGAPEGVGTAPMVAVRIRGESMHPMREGWLLFYRRDHAGVPEDCLNRLCVVKLAGDGPVLVKEVHRGYRADRFLLTSWNAPPLEDVAVDWAAPVLSIRP
jgi:DNA-binding transcriptional regulator YiaG